MKYSKGQKFGKPNNSVSNLYMKVYKHGIIYGDI